MTKDRKGRDLKVGDEVIIRAKVSYLNEHAGIVHLDTLWQGGAPTDVYLPQLQIKSQLCEFAAIPLDNASNAEASNVAKRAKPKTADDLSPLQLSVALQVIANGDVGTPAYDRAAEILSIAMSDPTPRPATANTSPQMPSHLKSLLEFLQSRGAVSTG